MMHVAVRDEKVAREVATVLRETAKRVEDGDIMYVAMTAVHTVAGGRRHGYAAIDISERIETLGLGEYFLVLGVLRDFFLKAEAGLIDGEPEKPTEPEGT